LSVVSTAREPLSESCRCAEPVERSSPTGGEVRLSLPARQQPRAEAPARRGTHFRSVGLRYTSAAMRVVLHEPFGALKRLPVIRRWIRRKHDALEIEQTRSCRSARLPRPSPLHSAPLGSGAAPPPRPARTRPHGRGSSMAHLLEAPPDDAGGASELLRTLSTSGSSGHAPAVCRCSWAPRAALRRPRAAGPGFPRDGVLASEPGFHGRAAGSVCELAFVDLSGPRSVPPRSASIYPYSRECPSTAVVGSQPWNRDVMIRRSPRHRAHRACRRAGSLSPAGSGGSLPVVAVAPQLSVSTRLTKTRARVRSP